jgi:hypothetical protein
VKQIEIEIPFRCPACEAILRISSRTLVAGAIIDCRCGHQVRCTGELLERIHGEMNEVGCGSTSRAGE